MWILFWKIQKWWRLLVCIVFTGSVWKLNQSPNVRSCWPTTATCCWGRLHWARSSRLKRSRPSWRKWYVPWNSSYGWLLYHVTSVWRREVFHPDLCCVPTPETYVEVCWTFQTSNPEWPDRVTWYLLFNHQRSVNICVPSAAVGAEIRPEQRRFHALPQSSPDASTHPGHLSRQRDRGEHGGVAQGEITVSTTWIQSYLRW